MLEHKADQSPPLYASVSAGFTDVRDGIALTVGGYSRFGMLEFHAGVFHKSGTTFVNKIGGQGFVFLFQKRVMKKNAITLARRRVYADANSAVYEDYLTEVDAEKNRSLAAHFSFMRKTYLGAFRPHVIVNGQNFHLLTITTNEIACGFSFVANAHQKWKLTWAPDKPVYSETSLYRLTGDLLYFAGPSQVTLVPNAQGISPEAPAGTADSLLPNKIGFRFLAEAFIPVRASRLDYGFVFQAGVTSTPFDGELEWGVAPILSAGICIRPQFKPKD